jgi:hypothetical protein
LLHVLTTAYGTSRTSGDVRLESAKWAKADIDQVAVTDRARARPMRGGSRADSSPLLLWLLQHPLLEHVLGLSSFVQGTSERPIRPRTEPKVENHEVPAEHREHGPTWVRRHAEAWLLNDGRGCGRGIFLLGDVCVAQRAFL